MTTDRTRPTDFDRLASAWLADGPTELVDRVLHAALREVHSTHQRRAPRVPWRFPRRFTTMTSSLRLVAAAIAVVAVVGGGAIWYVGQSTHPSLPTSTQSPIPSFTSAPTALPPPSQLPAPSPEVGLGWPTTGPNPPGVYSWDGRRCAGSFSAGQSCSYWFMHDASGPGNAAITIDELPEKPVAAGATVVTIAGHSGLYRRVVEPEPSFALDFKLGFEEWIVEIDGVVVAIRLYAKPGTSEADLADAHAIIDSMRYELRETGQPTQGFRLVFTLTTGYWDSG
jgi:hypothetical protein